MAQNLLQWHMIAIYAPNDLKVDIFDLLCKRGGAFFQVFFTPDWTTKLRKKYFMTDMPNMYLHEVSRPYIRDITECFQRFRKFYTKRNFRHKDDTDKTDFLEVWRAAVPA